MVFFTCFYLFSGYLRKYERAFCQTKTTGNKSSRKKQYISAVLPEIKEILEKGMGTSLSDMRDTVNENYIQFCKPYAKNQSLLIFSAK